MEKRGKIEGVNVLRHTGLVSLGVFDGITVTTSLFSFVTAKDII